MYYSKRTEGIFFGRRKGHTIISFENPIIFELVMKKIKKDEGSKKEKHKKMVNTLEI